MSKTLVLVGRFQPFHNGHLGVLRWCLGQGDVVITLGSDQLTPDIKNPWYPVQRVAWISACLHPHERDRIKFISVRDHPGDDGSWVDEVRTKVNCVIQPNTQLYITGYRSDSSSYYLHIFDGWSFLGPEQTDTTIHATEIREKYFGGKTGWEKELPPPVIDGLREFRHTHTYYSLALQMKGRKV